MAQSIEKSPNQPVDGPEDISPRGWKRILIDTWKDAGKDNLTLIAAGVAFYAFLAFVPLLTALVLSYGLVAEPLSVVSHMQTLTSIMPSEAARMIGDQLRTLTETSSAKHGFALLLAIAIALYGSSKGAGAILTALNVVFEVQEKRSFVKRTALTLAMTAGAVIVLFLAILAVSALHLLEAVAPNLGGAMHFGIRAAFFLIAGGAVVLLLAMIYRYGPDRPDQAWKWITPGSAAATIVWLAATAGFGLYVSNFGNYNATYGSLGAVIVFLTWLYLTAYVVLMGAELNSIMEIEASRVAEREAGPGSDTVRAGSLDASDETDSPRTHPTRPSARAAQKAPSAAAVAARIGLLGLLLGLLGRSRRPPLAR